MDGNWAGKHVTAVALYGRLTIAVGHSSRVGDLK